MCLCLDFLKVQFNLCSNYILPSGAEHLGLIVRILLNKKNSFAADITSSSGEKPLIQILNKKPLNDRTAVEVDARDNQTVNECENMGKAVCSSEAFAALLHFCC